jgi:hypothetical protein
MLMSMPSKFESRFCGEQRTISLNAPRAAHRPLLAGSTQWGTRHIAAIEKFVVSANVGFLAQGPTHPIGHNQPVTCTLKLPSERLLYI